MDGTIFFLFFWSIKLSNGPSSPIAAFGIGQCPGKQVAAPWDFWLLLKFGLVILVIAPSIQADASSKQKAESELPSLPSLEGEVLFRLCRFSLYCRAYVSFHENFSSET